MPEPYPIAVIVCLSLLALSITLGFPTKDTLEKMTADLKAAQKKLRQQHRIDLEAKGSSGVAAQGAYTVGKDGKLMVPNKNDL